MATYRIAITLVDLLGNETPPSAELVVGPPPGVGGDVTPGQTITVNTGNYSTALFSSKFVYRSVANGNTLYRVNTVAPNVVNVGIDTTSDAITANPQPPLAVSVQGPPQGAKHIKFLKDRLYYGNAPAFPSRLFPSNIGSPDQFDQGLEQDLGQNDNQEITGFGVVSGELAVYRTSSIYVLPGDPADIDPVQRISDAGAFVPNTILEVDNLNAFISHRGVMLFDGFNVTRIDIPVRNETFLFFGAVRPSSTYFERTMRWSRQHETDPTKTVVLIYDVDFKRFIKNIYPSRPTWLLSLLAPVTVGSTIFPAGLMGLARGAGNRVKRYENGTTDEGAVITARARSNSVAPDADNLETRLYEVVPDVTASTTDTIQVTTRMDTGSGDSTVVNGVLTGSGVRQFVAMPQTTGMYGRFVDVEVSFTGGLILHRLAGRYHPRQRDAQEARQQR